MTKVVLQARDLQVTIGNQCVLNGISLEVVKGESLFILGRSGEGKSVLLKSLLGLFPHQSGNVFYHEGTTVMNLMEKPRRWRFGRIGLVLQYPVLNESLSVYENLRWISPEKTEFEIKHLATVVGLPEHLLRQEAAMLSQTQKKRVALLQQIVRNPQIYFLDEPTTGLEPEQAFKLSATLRLFQKNTSSTMVIVSHDYLLAREHGDKVAFIEQGKLVWQGSAAQLDAAESPLVQAFRECYHR